MQELYNEFKKYCKSDNDLHKTGRAEPEKATLKQQEYSKK
jgi:hypothetical protein